MKKIILTLICALAFANTHGQTDDPDLQLALKGKYTEAFSGFKKRCDTKKDAYACGMTAYFYDRGFGVEKNKKNAIEYYKKGCLLNDADSCTILGYYYYKGENLPKDISKAKEMLEKACKLGSKDACKYKNNLN